MKNLITVIILLLLNINLIAQEEKEVITMRASMFSSAYLDGDTFTNYDTPWRESNLLVVIKENENITLYTKRPITLSIIKDLDLQVDNDGDKIYSWTCVDNKGEILDVKYVVFTNSTEKHLYLLYDTYKIFYFIGSVY